MDSHTPIFPLNAVLFPEGVLSLRVFETRYVDMVRDCLRDEQPFGICLIRSGKETGAPATPETTGCLARITLWDMEQLGVLNLRVRGLQRFQITSSTSDATGLQHAEIELIAPDAAHSIPATASPCVTLLRRIVGEIEEKLRQEDRPINADNLPLPFPYQFDNAAWVANRLCEILQLPLKAKQKLMELEDGAVRLSLVQQYLQQHKVV